MKELRINGRGAQSNVPNRFLVAEMLYDAEWEHLEEKKGTRYLAENAKGVLNRMNSPDLPKGLSLNPYQGCEHGCVYCYARNTQEYFGKSAGLDFEREVHVKKNAAELLEQSFLKKSWKAETIFLSGNTDCYQPAESKYGITRAILKLCLKYRNPVSIITKNTLVLRDVDLLRRLAELNLCRVIFSITCLHEELRRYLEPRTATALKRMAAVKTLSQEGVPVGVMTAPIIPSLNDMEIPELVRCSAENGAKWCGYTVVRLNGSVEPIFTEWVKRFYPAKAEKIIKQIKELHGGNLSDSRTSVRMKGEGVWAKQIKQLHEIAVKKYLGNNLLPPLDHTLFTTVGQLKLF